MTTRAMSRGVASRPLPSSTPTRRLAAERSSLLDAEGLASWLGVEVVYVRRLVSERRIPFVKLGKYVRFDPDEVAGWVDGLRVQPTPRTASRNRRKNR
jgi:excisionase family DNA binding protein